MRPVAARMVAATSSSETGSPEKAYVKLRDALTIALSPRSVKLATHPAIVPAWAP
jgi:hypothetical protein